MPHNRQEILDFLSRRTLLALATHGQGAIRCRCMFYAADDDFVFYLLAGKGSEKTKEMVADPRVTLLVIEERPNMLESVEAEVIGNAVVLSDPGERRKGLEILAPKNPAAGITQKTGSLELFDVIKVTPSALIYRVYGEATSGVGATTIDFTRKAGDGGVDD